ncbi:MAG: NAD(+)/NADH kinase [Dehalococcoidia bacterium]
MRKRVGILFQPKKQAARDLAQQMAGVLGDLNVTVWICSSWEEDKAREQTDGTELIICLGGDGTILRAARIANPLAIPILGVNLGRVGFMTELRAEDALNLVPAYVRDEGWVEERAMLQAELVAEDASEFQALNDVVVGRGERCRLIRVKATVNGESVTTYKCDGVIVATATGSTGYSLAAGGPVLHPLAEEIIMQPIAAHLSWGTALVLPSEAMVELEVSTTHKAMLSIDGQVEVPLGDGDVVKVKRSPNVTRLLRAQSHTLFYETLTQKLANRD